MVNSSFYDAFERMWQHVLSIFNNYVTMETLEDHISTQKNPHGITKEDIDLVNVDNTSDANKPISDATQEALDDKVDFETLNEHTENVNNPHAVTAVQVGALPITGGAMENALTLRGIILTEGIDYGSGNPGSGVLGQVYFKKVT